MGLETYICFGQNSEKKGLVAIHALLCVPGRPTLHQRIDGIRYRLPSRSCSSDLRKKLSAFSIFALRCYVRESESAKCHRPLRIIDIVPLPKANAWPTKDKSRRNDLLTPLGSDLCKAHVTAQQESPPVETTKMSFGVIVEGRERELLASVVEEQHPGNLCFYFDFSRSSTASLQEPLSREASCQRIRHKTGKAAEDYASRKRPLAPDICVGCQVGLSCDDNSCSLSAEWYSCCCRYLISIGGIFISHDGQTLRFAF